MAADVRRGAGDPRRLADLLAPGLPPLSPERVLDITRQLCITLQFIHQAGRLHRDLKPANVMVCDDGSVRLLDFGIARSTEPTPIGILTRPGENPHTPDYASPEQKTGGPVDERTDLYGLGRGGQPVEGLELVAGNPLSRFARPRKGRPALR